MRLRRLLRIGLLAAACALAGWSTDQRAGGTEEAPAAIKANERATDRQGSVFSYASVASLASPSVVSVFSKKFEKGHSLTSLSDMLRDPFVIKLFGSAEDLNAVREVTSLGSGVVVSKDGYILTNNHVVDGAQDVEVSFHRNGKARLKAKVVGRDDLTDLAVLKVETNHLAAIPFANSDSLKVGDVVLAVGNPFAVGQTVTMGIVSAVKRGGLGTEGDEDFIQTDAAINPGSSGGALVDDEGRLVGINTAILSGNGGNQGIGFAIPSNVARRVMEQLIAHGRIVRGYLGVGVQDMTPELAKVLNLPGHTAGALVSEVKPKDAAARAGLKVGDIIVALAGKPIKDGTSLRRLVAALSPGKQVGLRILRDGATESLKPIVQDRPPPHSAQDLTAPPINPQTQALSGLAVADLDGPIREHLHIPGHIQGALIVKIDAGSAAYEAGLRVGDVIQEIDHQTFSNAEQATRVIKGFRKKQALILAWNSDGTKFVPVLVPERS